MTPVYAYTRPTLYPKQEAAIFHPARYGVVEASTKSGKTVGCLVWLLEQALEGGEGSHYWWIAPTAAQAKIACERLLRLTTERLYTVHREELSLTLPHGAKLWFKTGENPDALYGEDVVAAVIDEASRVKEDAWFAVRSTLTATRGPIRIIGNVRGRRNWAYQLAREAEAGAPDMHYARLTAADAVAAGILDAEEIADARRRLPEATFRELYWAEPAESLSLIYAPFGAANVTERADYVASGGPIYVGFDWGFTDPTHIGLYQLRDGALYQFDEFVGAGRSEQAWVTDVLARLGALPGIPATPDGWPKLPRNGKRPPQVPETWPEAVGGDPSAVQLREEFRAQGIRVFSPAQVHHSVTAGQDVLRAAICSGDETRRFFLHPRCAQTRLAFESYRATELAAGQFDPRPAPDTSNHRYSHGTDQARYLVWALRDRLGLTPQKTWTVD